MRLRHHKTQVINHQIWEPLNIKQLEPKVFDKTKRYSEDTPPRAET